MKIIETAGIVLKTMDFKEKDSILTFLTHDAGKKAGILHGGKSVRSGNAAKVELFVINHFEYSEKPSAEMVRIRKCELLESFPALRKNYAKFLHASNSSAVYLHPGSLAFFRERHTSLHASSAIRPTHNNLKELDQAIFVYFRHYFGRDLKSHALLKENSWKN
jgi:recombinational DNA repair protein (RecF pathway)